MPTPDTTPRSSRSRSRSATPPIVLLHAYDGRNRGDRLLVEESLLLLERAGISRGQCVMVAMHAASFSDLGSVRQLPAAAGRGDRRPADLAALAAMDAAALLPTVVRPRAGIFRIVHDARLVVGVGGGYLRAPRQRTALDTFAFHFPQLVSAAGAACPSIYLPQSVGPLEGPLGRAIQRQLQGITWLGLRDDRSVAEVAEGIRAHRVPDLGVLALARTLSGGQRPRSGGRVTAIIGRHLTQVPGYASRLLEVASQVDSVFAVHSRAAGQDDAAFYRGLGIEATVESPAALADERVGVVVSTRLHGALQAILAGVPALHLSYERKGFGAYSDLGLTEWLHDSAGFDPARVSAQAQALLRDPSPFWAAIESRLGVLLEADAALQALVREFVALV